MKKLHILLIALLSGFGSICAKGASVAAVQTIDGTAFAWRDVIGSNHSGTMGWSFVVGGQDLDVDALGIYDHGANGLQTAHPVGIWTSGGALLAQVTVPLGTAGTLVGSYRYGSIAPLTLTAGHTYVVGTYFAPVIDRCGSACGDEMLVFGTETFASGFTYLHSNQNRAKIGDGSLAFPDLDGEIAEAFFGPNFLITAADPVAAPEPTSLVLAGLGIGALLV